MILENDVLRVELDDQYPVVREALHKPTGLRVPGAVEWVPSLWVNKRPHPLFRCECTREEARYTIGVPEQEISLSFSFALDGNQIVWRLEDVVESGPEKLQTLYMKGHRLVLAGPDWRYRRERFLKRSWEEEFARGMWDPRTEEGLVGAAVPDEGTPALTYACVWNDDLCITAAASFAIKPVELNLREWQWPERTDHAALQMGEYHYRVGGKVLDPFEFRIAFLRDENGDGKVDYMDAWLWHRRRLPEPDPIYKESATYKIFCALPERVDTTFDQCLDIIKRVHLVSDGMPQIAYLVGWQYDGHDTGYPALDKINEKLGSRDDLLRLVEEAKRYNTIVSYHINLDDAYTDSPAWDPEIMCTDPDGTIYPFEVFNGRQAYHISHTKDVESGKLFQRLDAMMALVPVERTIHIDAFRICNESWEPDRYIGMTEELELGVRPIMGYFRDRGIDPSTESIDRYPADLTGLFSCIWHMDDPRLHFGKLLGGGHGENLKVWAIGASIDSDLTPEFSFERIADMIYLGTRLYQFYLTSELLDFRLEHDNELYMRFANGATVTADARAEKMRVVWDGIEVARNYDRFIPVDANTIYAYSRPGGPQSWALPESWEGAEVEAHTIMPEGIVEGPGLCISGRSIVFDAQPQRPIRLNRRQP